MSEQIPYSPPEYRKAAFHCPRCGAYSQQEWAIVSVHGGGQVFGLDVAYCIHCRNQQANNETGRTQTYSIWYLRKMIYPESTTVAPPNSDLAEDIKKDYLEAGGIINKSPRGAAAVLRLCIQKLCEQLGETSRDLNTNIGSLVQKGLNAKSNRRLMLSELLATMRYIQDR